MYIWNDKTTSIYIQNNKITSISIQNDKITSIAIQNDITCISEMTITSIYIQKDKITAITIQNDKITPMSEMTKKKTLVSKMTHSHLYQKWKHTCAYAFPNSQIFFPLLKMQYSNIHVSFASKPIWIVEAVKHVKLYKRKMFQIEDL